MTESKRRLDVAFVRVLTGLNSVAGILACKIDGESFNIRFEEVCCMENEIHLQHRWEMDEDSDHTQSEMGRSIDLDSILACMGSSQPPEIAEGDSAAGVSASWKSTTRAPSAAAHDASFPTLTARNHNEAGSMRFSRGSDGSGTRIDCSLAHEPRVGLADNGPVMDNIEGDCRPTTKTPEIQPVFSTSLGPDDHGPKPPLNDCAHSSTEVQQQVLIPNNDFF